MHCSYPADLRQRLSSATVVSDLQNDKLNGTDTGISIKVKALECHCCHINHFSQTALWVENVK